MFRKLLCPFFGLQALLALMLIDEAGAQALQCGPVQSMIEHEKNQGSLPTIFGSLANSDQYMVIFVKDKQFHVYVASKSQDMACMMAVGNNFTMVGSTDALPIGP